MTRLGVLCAHMLPLPRMALQVIHGAALSGRWRKAKDAILWVGSMPSVFGYFLYLKAGHLSHHAHLGMITPKATPTADAASSATAAAPAGTDSHGGSANGHGGSADGHGGGGFGLGELFASGRGSFEDGDMLFVAHRQRLRGSGFSKSISWNFFTKLWVPSRWRKLVAANYQLTQSINQSINQTGTHSNRRQSVTQSLSHAATQSTLSSLCVFHVFVWVPAHGRVSLLLPKCELTHPSTHTFLLLFVVAAPAVVAVVAAAAAVLGHLSQG